jgi:opacity protein-like surface antigen
MDRKSFWVRRWGLLFLLGLILLLNLPTQGFAAGESQPRGQGGPGGPPPPGGQGQEDPEEFLRRAILPEAFIGGTLYITPTGDVVLLNTQMRMDTDQGKIVLTDEKAKRTENYRIKQADLEKATDKQLEDYAKQIIQKTEIPLGQEDMGGQTRTVRMTTRDIINKLKEARDAYHQDAAGGKGIETQVDVDEYIKQVKEKGKFEPKKAEAGGQEKQPKEHTYAVPAPGTSTTPRWLKGAYVAANLGVGFTSAASFTPSFGENFNVTREQDDVVQHLGVMSAGSMSFPGNVNPSLVGGIKIGRYGCCFSDNPIWDYFGWCFDISYQRYSLSSQSGSFQRTTWVNGDLFSQGAGTAALQGDGSLFTLAFLVNARYGFLPTPEIPFGALQPYVGVGPALVVNRFDPRIALTGFNGVPVNGGLDFNGETSVNPGLAVEAGLRYYPFQHVFLDLSYRYLYARPDFSFTSNTAGLKLSTTINNSAVRFGVGYAF